MTNKERLSYFEKKYEEEKDVAKYAGITVTGDEFKWLIEQAERVEELEYDFWYYFIKANKLEKQNKRYREAIEKALAECVKDRPITAENILAKALESDEE